ncbi:hypothetical protein [Vallitalea guaymasensis]|uniref:Uncharacterized protein n=1 Tax=Vallitalea guaymasensis TaxID=1185412 RepID=A0A8J8MFS9_9FIRM|nr:hypothetical protein [Vallitalea guaymasensis]QUH31805.1 hypothetical protein HYG85_23865 [Vallitalea guaymasensis]
MTCNNNSFKNEFSNVLLFLYFLVIIIILILQIPEAGTIEKLIYLSGAITGVAIKTIIIFLYWYTIMPKYIDDDNKINIVKLSVGILLVLLAFYVFDFNFIVTFIILSIVIILKKDYHIFN